MKSKTLKKVKSISFKSLTKIKLKMYIAKSNSLPTINKFKEN